MANYKKFGDHIKRLRREKELTQAQLAEMARVEIRTLNRIENGEQNATLKTLTKLAKALKAHIDLLEFI